MSLIRFSLTLLCAATLMAISGCATSNQLVPKSVIHVTDASGKKFSLELPKDMEAESIRFDRISTGDISFEIQKIKVRTNPDVIGAAGVAQADAINAAGNQVRESIKLGIELAEKSKVVTP